MKFFSENWPFAPKKWPFFYGWVVLVCGILGLVLSIPGQTRGLSIFTDDLMGSMGLSRVLLSLSYMLGTMGSSLFLTWVGKAYDRLGARILMVRITIALGLTFFILSKLDSFTRFLARPFGESVFLPLSFIAMILGFFALRFLTQGALSLVSRNMVMKWFEKQRGLANGLLIIGMTAGMAVVPMLLNSLVDTISWRGTWQTLAIISGVGYTVIAWIFYRDNPEACGLHPDGYLGAYPKGSPIAVQEDFTLAEARQTYAFWAYNFSLCIMSLFGTGVPFHLVSIFAEVGYDRASAVSIFLPASMLSIPISFLSSWLSDRIPLKNHLIFFHLCMAIYITGLLYLHEPWGRTLLIAGSGMATGLSQVLGTIVWPRFFGRKHLGAISGYNGAWRQVISAIGPTVFGLSFTLTGTYRTAGWICLFFLTPLLIGAFRADPPKKHAKPPG